MDNVEGRAVAVSKSSSTSKDNSSAALLMLSLTTDNSIDRVDQTNNVAASSKTGANTAAEVSIKDFMSSLQQRDVDEPSTCVGRPKGTTAADFMCLEERIESAMKEVAEWLARNTTKSRSKKRLKKGLLQGVINVAKEKFDLDDSINICCGTVRQRVQQNSNGGHIGQASPMLDVEPYLVDLIIKLGEMRQPITTSQGLQLANSLINR
jgi:hypothetical protein